MAVDSNVGFNKSNALLDTSLTYEVDLTAPAKPTAQLIVRHTNRGVSDSPCVMLASTTPVDSIEAYTMDNCHWTYLRVYSSSGTQLLSATPQATPAEQTLREVAVPARVDNLNDEGIAGAQAFGTLVVIPQKKTVDTSFDFGLPASVLQQDSASGAWTYRLTVQKQPGTIAVPLIVRLHLPDGAELVGPPAEIQREGEAWVFTTNLRQDVILEIVFRVSQ